MKKPEIECFKRNLLEQISPSNISKMLRLLIEWFPKYINQFYVFEERYLTFNLAIVPPLKKLR